MNFDAQHQGCSQCVFSKQRKFEGEKPFACDLVVVTEAPTTNAILTGELIGGPAGKLFWSNFTNCVRTLGIKDADVKPVYVTSAIKCLLPQGTKMDTILTTKCRERLMDEIKATGAKYILGLGAVAVTALLGTGKFSISRIQGQVHKIMIGDEEKILIPAFHPALLIHRPAEVANFVKSIEMAVNALYGHEIVKSPGVTQWSLLDTSEAIHDFHALMINRAESSENKKLDLCCDIETSGLSFVNDRVLCIGICYDKNKAIVIPEELVHHEYAKQIFADARFTFIWHNGKFDRNFLRYSGHKARVDEDTILMHYALNEYSGTHGLELLSQQLLGAKDYKKELKGNLDDPKDSYDKLPKQILHQYQAEDVDNGLQVYHILKKQIENDPALNWLYRNILIPAQNFLSDVELKGFYTHLSKLEYAQQLLGEQIAEKEAILEKETDAYWDPEAYANDMDAKTAPAHFNPGSPKQVAWMVYVRFQCKPTIFTKCEKGVYDTGVNTLVSIENKPHFVQLLLELRGLKKLMSTYVKSLLEKRDANGRIHTTYSLYGTTTGRLSSKKPNVQNVPRDKLIKTVFGAPDGRLMIESDYKAAELRALGFFSQDPFLIKVFKEGLDLHDETALAMFGEGFTKNQRVQAKMINFGIMYGRGPKTISEACKITYEEAQESINKWLNRMPMAAAYLKSRREAVKTGAVLMSPFGRKRRFPIVSRQTLNAFQNEACNFAIQSMASDLTLQSAIRLHPQLKEMDAHIVNLVHDSILIELPEDKEIAQRVFDLCQKEMRSTSKMFFPELEYEFEVDCEIGKHWGELVGSVEEWFNKKEINAD